MSSQHSATGDFCQFTYRHAPTPDDPRHVRAIVESSGFFNPAEVDVAVELVDERLAKGAASGYFFVFAECDGRTVGYTCFGPIPATAASYDLYWIAVDQSCRGRGLGRKLLAESERLIFEAGGRRVYIETSNRPQYVPTRGFYERCGYRLEALLKDFYAPDDDKAVYVKPLAMFARPPEQGEAIHVERRGRTLVLTPRVNISTLAADNVQDELAAVLRTFEAGEAAHAVVDLGRVAHFGSEMLGALHLIWKRVHAAGGRMTLCNVSELGREVIEIAKFDTLWPIFGNQAEAIAAVEGPR